MLAKIMHHCAFLIITFSSFALCIQNGKSVTVDKLERNANFSPEARQSSFHQSDWDNTGFIPSNGGGFQFPDKHQYNTNKPNELPSVEYRNPYPNINQEANPHNLALNTGEYSANNANNHNNYPYRQHLNAIASFDNRERDSTNIPNANDFYLSQQATATPSYQPSNYKNPNYPPQRYGYQDYLQRPTYAQSHDNYLFNGQPNYNRRPIPPRPASYSPYQDGHLTPPYRNDLTSPSSSSSLPSSLSSSLSSLFTGPSTYPSQYANQFGNFAQQFGGGSSDTGGGGTAANPLGGLFNSIGAPFAVGNPLSMQIIRGLENIARNDDLQCVPKVLCQMLGSPTRRAQLPGFITSPVITSFLASLPSTSPALIYGRAALLGLSGGEYNCARTYSKCPQNEDDILYYLNNHRGGFFKFFNEPDSEPALDTQHHYSPSTSSSQLQQQSQPSIFNFLTGLGGTPTTTTTTAATNQGNLNSFMSDAVTNGIGSLFGNIISGFLNGQTATRRNDDDDDDDEEFVDSDLIESNSTTTEPSSEQVEGRILNNKSNILAYAEPTSNPISFPLGDGGGGGANGGGNDYNNYEAPQFETEFRFPTSSGTSDRDVRNSDNDDDDDHRRGKRVNFIDTDSRPTYGTKMVFPDRTGTGNLRFDNDEYFRVGKIINRPDYNRRYKEKESYTTTTTTRRTPYYRDYTKGSASYMSNSNAYLNRYASSNYRQENSQADTSEDISGNVYVANGQGIVEYYINPQGKKVYLPK